MFNFMKKGVGAIERDREKLDRDKDRRKKEKKQRKEITSIPGSMSSEELLRLDEVSQSRHQHYPIDANRFFSLHPSLAEKKLF